MHLDCLWFLFLLYYPKSSVIQLLRLLHYSRKSLFLVDILPVQFTENILICSSIRLYLLFIWMTRITFEIIKIFIIFLLCLVGSLVYLLKCGSSNSHLDRITISYIGTWGAGFIFRARSIQSRLQERFNLLIFLHSII